MAGILDDPQLLQGLLGQQDPNADRWGAISRALGAAAQGYTAGLATNPRLAFAAGLGAAGQQLNAEHPLNTPEARLKKLQILSEIQKNMRGEKPQIFGTDEGGYSTLSDTGEVSQLRPGSGPKPDDLGKAQAALKALEDAGQGSSAEAQNRRDQIFKMTHWDPKAGTNVHVENILPGNQDLTKQTLDAQQKAFIDAEKRVKSIDQSMMQFKPGNFTYGAQIRGLITKYGLKGGLPDYVPEAWKQEYQGYVDQMSQLQAWQSDLRHALNGAALSPQELELANQWLINPKEDDPISAWSKLQGLRQYYEQMRGYTAETLKHGLDIGTPTGPAPSPPPPAGAVASLPPGGGAGAASPPGAAPAAPPAAAPAPAPMAPPAGQPASLQEARRMAQQMIEAGQDPAQVEAWAQQQAQRLKPRGASGSY